jgi:hypothetical protein
MQVLTAPARGGFRLCCLGEATMRGETNEGFPARLTKQGLLQLAVAARLVHRRSYPEQYAIASAVLGKQQLDGLACLLSATAAIYTVNHRSARYRELTAEELASGVFRDGAHELVFLDGRPAIQYLAATSEGTRAAARRLRELTNEAGRDAPTRTDRSPPTPTR